MRSMCGADACCLAINYQSLQGKFEEALELYKKALGIWIKHGPDHPFVASSYNNMANVFQSQVHDRVLALPAWIWTHQHEETGS